MSITVTGSHDVTYDATSEDLRHVLIVDGRDKSLTLASTQHTGLRDSLYFEVKLAAPVRATDLTTWLEDFGAERVWHTVIGDPTLEERDVAREALEHVLQNDVASGKIPSLTSAAGWFEAHAADWFEARADAIKIGEQLLAEAERCHQERESLDVDAWLRAWLSTEVRRFDRVLAEADTGESVAEAFKAHFASALESIDDEMEDLAEEMEDLAEEMDDEYEADEHAEMAGELSSLASAHGTLRAALSVLREPDALNAPAARQAASRGTLRQHLARRA